MQALLIIDVQLDFTSPSGKLPADQHQVAEMIGRVNELVGRVQGRIPVVCIGNEFKRWDPLNLFRKFAAIAGSPGTGLDPRLQVPSAAYFNKSRSSALSNPALQNYLQLHQIDGLLVTGLYAEGCVLATIRAALKRGLQVTVLTDCIASRSEKKKNRMLKKYSSMGAVLTTTAGSWAR
jgi:nicotinamidase-related amidase